MTTESERISDINKAMQQAIAERKAAEDKAIRVRAQEIADGYADARLKKLQDDLAAERAQRKAAKD